MSTAANTAGKELACPLQRYVHNLTTTNFFYKHLLANKNYVRFFFIHNEVFICCQSRKASFNDQNSN